MRSSRQLATCRAGFIGIGHRSAFLVNASVQMNAYPCESATRASCFVSAQRVYIPTAVPSGKLGKYKQPRTITNTRAHERLRNKPSPPIMARVEIKTRKIATAAPADVAIQI